MMIRVLQYLMGGETSVPQQNPKQESNPNQKDDLFILQPLESIQLPLPTSVTHYLIIPNPKPNPTLLSQLRAYFKVEHFVDMKTFKKEMSFVRPDQRVKVILGAEISTDDMKYLQIERKVYQIIMVGAADPPLMRKIAAVLSKWDDLLATLQQLQGKDRLQLPTSNILLVDQDTKLLNKYRLNYHCATTYKNKRQAKQHFLALANHLFPQRKEELLEFQEKYNPYLSGQEWDKVVLGWAFRDSFYWRMIDTISRNTTDPKRMAYLRLALKDLHDAVLNEWKRKPLFDFIYIIIDITDEERQKLLKSQKRYLLFTTFVKGYTNQQAANAQLKSRPHAFKFTIAPNRGKLQSSLDFGFAIRKGQYPNGSPNVLINIYNVFQVMAISGNSRRGELLSNVLPFNYLRRRYQRDQMTQKQLDLVRNYDYLQDMMGKIDGQATLLQIAGYFQDSLKLYDLKAETLREAKEYDHLARCVIQKGDALRRSAQFEAAEKQYQFVVSQQEPFKSASKSLKAVSKVHLAELYLHHREEVKLNQMLTELERDVQLLKEERQQSWRARSLLAVGKIRKNEEANALNLLQNLKNEVSITLDQSYQGRPLVHDIYRCLATCKFKLGHTQEAVALLTSTLSWQLACEGKTPNVALTETLIQTVTRSYSNNTNTNRGQEDLTQPIRRVESMKQVRRDHANGFELAGLGHDLIRSLGKMDALLPKNVPPKEEKPILNQSAVNVEISEETESAS